MQKDKSKAERMLRSESARQRRRQRKNIVTERTLHLFAKLRRLRRKKSA